MVFIVYCENGRASKHGKDTIENPEFQANSVIMVIWQEDLNNIIKSRMKLEETTVI